jgi:hypothetical protein
MHTRSYVDVSAGGDKEITSFYCTTASSTWKDPFRITSPKKIPELETGYSINAVARYQKIPEGPRYLTTYRQAINENLSRYFRSGKRFSLNRLSIGGHCNISFPFRTVAKGHFK